MPREYKPRVDRVCEHCGAAFSVQPHRIPMGRARFCSKACKYAYSPPLEQVLWGRVDRSDPDACWLWPGQLRMGYGVVCHRKRRYSAHRLAWELTNGPIPDGADICHSCDARYAPGDTTYRRCINPAHTWPGTNDENMADMAAKGRAASGASHGSHIHPERVARGEANARAVLTAAQVIDARQRYRPRVVTLAMLSAEYGCTPETLHKAIRGTTWKSV